MMHDKTLIVDGISIRYKYGMPNEPISVPSSNAAVLAMPPLPWQNPDVLYTEPWQDNPLGGPWG